MSKNFNNWFDYHQPIFSPLSRSRLYFLLIVFSLVLPWSLFYQIEERHTALGRLEPKSGAIAVKSSTDGTVAKILVSEGDQVKTGSTLIELDSSRLQSLIQQNWTTLETEEKRREQLQLSNQKLEVTLLDQQQNEQLQLMEQRFKVEELKQELKRLFQDYETQKLSHSNTVAINYQNPAVTRSIENQYQNQLLNLQNEIIETRSRLEQENKDYQFLINSRQLETLSAKNRIQNNNSNILSLQIKTKRLEEEIKILESQLTQYTIKSPTTGTVFEVNLNKIGTKVNPRMSLVDIVPKNAPLIVRSQLDKPLDNINLEGLAVNLKFVNYPDHQNSPAQGKIVKVISSPTSDKKYLEIELEEKCHPLGDRCVPLQVGETAVVEIITGHKRAIKWLLEPFYQGKRS